jgi:HEAT repeat protein
MLRRIVITLCVLLSITACNTDSALDFEQLEARARAGDAEAVTRLAGLLSASEAELADRTYALLLELGQAAVPVLLDKVNSADKQVREYAIAAMGNLKVAAAVPAISKVLADTSLERRYVAAWALGQIDTAAAVAPLIAALDDTNSEVRRYATRALIKLNRLALLPLIEYLPRAQGEEAAAAIRALGDIADRRALDVLLEQAEGEQRGEAFLALGKLRSPQAESALIAGLTDADSRVRMNAAMALGPLGGSEAVPPLQRTLEDEVHVVREWSARSLEMITGRPVLYRNSKGEYVRPYKVYH